MNDFVQTALTATLGGRMDTVSKALDLAESVQRTRAEIIIFIGFVVAMGLICFCLKGFIHNGGSSGK